MHAPASSRLLIVSAAVLALAGGCAVGPSYKQPQATATPAAFKEPSGWLTAAPGDAAARGTWWEAFHDATLDSLEAQVASSNQTLLEDASNYEEARQIARADRATFFPSLSAVGSAERIHPAAGTSQYGTALSSTTTNIFSAGLDASWTPDFWGKIRQQVRSDVAAAQASAANLASARLATQALLAQDYIALRASDEKRRLLDDAVAAYKRTLTITQNQYAVGVSARSDVISAEALLDAERASAIDVGVQRAQYEHAIAVLVGKLPADLSIAPEAHFTLDVPAIPPQVASELVQRRPDVASAERMMAEENAKVGVQTAAYFPDISLSADGGYQGSPLDRLFSAPFRMWSLGADASEPLIDFGQRRALLKEAEAAYDSTVAAYRASVLTAFQQVEDNLAGLRILSEEGQVESVAVSEASEAARIAENEYKAGTQNFTYVVTAQVAEVTDKVAALNIQQQRLTDAVALIQALGGGWTVSDLPTRGQVLARHPQDPAAVAAPQP